MFRYINGTITLMLCTIRLNTKIIYQMQIFPFQSPVIGTQVQTITKILDKIYNAWYIDACDTFYYHAMV